MSWVFAVLLLAYSALRSAGWFRGQFRWRRERATIERARPARSIDPHFDSELRRVHAELNELRAEIDRREFEIRRASVTDPDVCFGVVRSSRYRTAVRRISGTLDAWLHGFRREDAPALEGLRSGPGAFDRLAQHADWLASEARVIARTRALEGFEVDRVRQAADVMAQCRALIYQWQGELEQPGRQPYRRDASELRVAV